GPDLGPEKVGKGAVEAAAPFVAVIGRVEPVGGGDRLHDLGMHRRRIVGKKPHSPPLASSFAPGPARSRACALRRRRFSRSAAARRSSRLLSFSAMTARWRGLRTPATGLTRRARRHRRATPLEMCCRSSVVERILGKAELV